MSRSASYRPASGTTSSFVAKSSVAKSSVESCIAKFFHRDRPSAAPPSSKSLDEWSRTKDAAVTAPAGTPKVQPSLLFANSSANHVRCSRRPASQWEIEDGWQVAAYSFWVWQMIRSLLQFVTM